MDLNNKTAIITGGASGLGQATAELFAAQGANVMLLDFNEANCIETVSRIGERAKYFITDVSSDESVSAAVAATLDAFGAIHIAVNCAGIAPPSKVLNREGEPLALEKFKKIVDVNLNGTFNVIRLAAAAMLKNEPLNDDGGRGVIINVASVAAFDGQIGQPAYAASKAGVAGMTLPIAREFARYGIRVNTIAPGLFNTPIAAVLPPEAVEALSQSVEYPKRLGNPTEFAKLAAFMVDNDYLNGEVIRLDGAIRMQAK